MGGDDEDRQCVLPIVGRSFHNTDLFSHWSHGDGDGDGSDGDGKYIALCTIPGNCRAFQIQSVAFRGTISRTPFQFSFAKTALNQYDTSSPIFP